MSCRYFVDCGLRNPQNDHTVKSLVHKVDRERQEHFFANASEGLFPFEFSVLCYKYTHIFIRQNSEWPHLMKSKPHTLSATSH